MEFPEKLQQLRKQKGLTQEELAAALYVSRTAVSKWESGRGYPGIDSLKAIAEYFSVTVDALLSGDELLNIAQKDSHRNKNRICDLVFGLLDCGVALLLFLPFFGQTLNGEIREVSLISLTVISSYLRIGYFAVVIGSVLWGLTTLVLQTYQQPLWLQCKSIVSLGISVVGTLLFVVGSQPYAAALLLVFLVIKGAIRIRLR